MAEKKKKATKQKRMVAPSPRPVERPDELFDSAGARAVEGGNRSARHNADEYRSIVEGYAKGGAVCRGGGMAMRGTKFRGVR